MKDFVKRWLGIGNPSKREFEDLAASAVESLAKAQQAHISDLRVLIDKGHEREAQLAKMVEMAMEAQFYRPRATGQQTENKITPAIPAESMNDVAVFDDAEDAQQMKAQEEELRLLIQEQNDSGVNKVTA